MSQRISLLIHDLRLGQKSKQINNFTRNTGGGNSEGWEATSGFFEASFRLILGCYNASDCLGTSLRVVLGVVSKLQITTLWGRLACTAAPSQDLFLAHTPKGNRASAHKCLTKVVGACLCGWSAIITPSCTAGVISPAVSDCVADNGRQKCSFLLTFFNRALPFTVSKTSDRSHWRFTWYEVWSGFLTNPLFVTLSSVTTIRPYPGFKKPNFWSEQRNLVLPFSNLRIYYNWNIRRDKHWNTGL